MFTGIVEELGEIVAIEPLGDGARLRVRGPLVASDAVHGGSVAVNGVCLTVVDAADGEFTADVMQVHVDATAPVVSRTTGDRWEVVRVGLPDGLARYVVDKRSVAVDGVSLTASAVGDGWFEVSLIPTTLQLTTLGRADVGAAVNLEVDVLGKYVERLLGDRR